MIPEEHHYEELAFRALRDLLPWSWQPRTTRGLYSGYEYGQDWIFEIVENGKPTGAEFSVQNKVGIVERQEHISIRMRMTVVERLLRVNRPVIIHAYDKEKQTSYWTWLTDWYYENRSPNWKHQQTVTVTIPKSNILNPKAVNEIRRRVLDFHDEQSYSAWASLPLIKSRWDTSYKRSSELTGHGQTLNTLLGEASDDIMTLTVVPKGQTPPPVLKVNDPNIANLLLKASDTGLSLVIEGKLSEAISIDELPLPPHLSSIDEITKIAVYHPVPTDPLPIQLLALDATGRTISLFPRINMKWTQVGRRVLKLIGSPPEIPTLKVELAFERLENEITQSILNMKFALPEATVNEWSGFLNFVRNGMTARSLVVRWLDSGLETTAEVAEETWKPLSEYAQDWLYELIESLSMLQRVFSISFGVPEELSYSVLEQVRPVVTVIQTGKLKVNINQLIPQAEIDRIGEDKLVMLGKQSVFQVRKWVEHFTANGELLLPIETLFPANAVVFDQKIELGKAKYAVGIQEFLEPPNIAHALKEMQDDETLQVTFRPDTNAVMMLFEDWPTDENE